MATTPTPNLKKFVIASVRPLIAALRQYVSDWTLYVTNRLNAQDIAIQSEHVLISENTRRISEIDDTLLKLNQDVISLKDAIPSATVLMNMQNRVTELNYLTRRLYDALTDIVEASGGSVTLPDFDNPNVMRERVLTDEELEKAWRIARGIRPDTTLTPAQKADLNSYIIEYHR